MNMKLLSLFISLLLSILTYAQPPNDDCANATTLDCTVTNGTNIGATASTSGGDDSYAAADICAASLENTVWYEYTATANGTVDVNFTNISCNSGFGVQLGVFTGPCGGPYTPVGNCVNGNPPPPLSFPAVAGQSYYIVVDGDAGDNCTWDVNICPPGGCGADAGTQTVTVDGTPATSPVFLCWGECIDIISNDDYVLPTPTSGEDSELMYALYSCAPTDPDPNADACYTGLLWTGEDFSDCNNAGSILLGAGLGPTVYFVPITADDGDNNGNPNGVINWDQDGDGCFDMGPPIEVNFMNPITFTSSEDCANGSVDITINGGLPEFTGGNYTVTNTGAGTVTGTPVSHGGTITITGLNNGDNYSISVTDANGCTATFSGGPILMPSITGNVVVDVTCNGGNDGSITITVTGGTPPIQYSNNNGATFQGSNVFNGLSAGTYDIVVQDASGCQDNIQVTVNEPPALNFNTTPTNPTCNGGTDGSIVVNASGGTTPYQYSNDNGATFQAGNTFNGLGAGSYDIVVEDANGCQTTATVVLTDPPAVAFNTTVVDATCGNNNGSITVNVTAGVSPYQYSNDNGGTFQGANVFNGLAPGSYDIVVQDADGCTATATVNVVDQPGPNITGTTPVDPSCGASDGSITVTATGGTAPLQYSDDNGATFQAGNVFNGLPAGTYDIVVEDANGCQATVQVTLNNTAGPNITNTAFIDPSCGGSDGSITITASGGTPPLQYSNNNGATFQAGNVFNGLPAGTYDMVVEDANGCQATTQVVLTDTPGPTIDNTIIVDVSCNGGNDGSITITASGGTTPLQYSNDNGATFQASNTFNGLTAGTYDLVVEDANGCQATLQVQVNEPTALAFNTTPTDPTCNGDTDGSIVVNANGGTTPYQYSNDNGATFQASNTFNGLAAGSYDIVVEDANGCQTTATVVLTDPPAVAFNTTVVDATCGNADGSITVNVTAGVSPYQYSSDNGATFQASNILNGLVAGNYDVVVQDANGCTATLNVTVNNQAAPTITNTATVDPTCGNSNGSIDVTASGGTPPLQYSNDNGATFQAGNVFNGLPAGTYDMVVEDANGCQATTQVVLTDTPGPTIDNTIIVDVSCNGGNDGSITITASGGTTPLQYSNDNGATFQASNTFNGLTAGTYDLVVEDANGCQATLQVQVNEPTALAFNTTPTDPTCNGDTDGSIVVNANGGTTPYQYSNDNGATFQASNTFNGLAAGSYDIVVEDANGCQTTATVVLTDPPAVAFNTTVVDATCGNADGSITVNVTAGVSPYQYSSDNGATFQASNVLNGLAAGNYDVVVQDANGCTATLNVSVNNQAAPTITNTATVDPTCGNSNGSIDVTASGGTPPLQYSNDNGATFQAGNVFNGLPAGTYDMVVEDANGCQATTQVVLTDTPGPTIDNTIIVDVSCNGGNDGSITITASGGTTPLQYSNDNGATFQASNTFNGLTAGTYDLVVEDANGCQATLQVQVNEPTALAFNTTPTDPTCNGDTDGSIVVNANGGTTPYQYSNDNGATFQASNTFNGLAASSYDIVVEDANGCQTTATVVLTDPPAVAFNTTVVDATCGNADGSITVNVTAGVSPYQYSSDNGATFQASNVLNGLAAGNYDVVVQDANGCTATLNVSVNNQAAPTITNTAFTDPLCNGACDGTITITANGGVSPLQYSIDNGVTFQAGNAFNGICDGTYDIVVEDANGCQVLDQVTLTEPPVMSYAAVLTDLTCFQDGTGAIEINAQGGDGGPYQYSIDNGVTWQAGNIFNGLAAGNYDIVVQDGNGCTVTGTETLNEPTQLTITFSAFDETCAGACDGFAIVIPGGGITPYDYTWSSSANNSPTENNLCAGNFDLTVTDANGCTVDTIAFPIIGPPAVTIDNVTITDELCNGDCNGSIDVDAPTATSFSIDGGVTFQASNVFNGLCAGNYDIVVEDANGCSATMGVSVLSPPVLTANISNDTTICDGGTASLISNGVGGTPNYTYVWDDPNATAGNALNINTAGTYTVTITDANGCTTQASVTVSVNPPLTVTAQSDQAICPGESATLTANGGGGNGGPYTYDWTNDDGSGWTATGGSISVSPTTTTTYTVTVSDNCGSVTTTDQVTITVNTVPTVNFVADNLSGCLPVTVNFNNLTDPLMTGTCFWDFGDGNTSNTCDPTHTYTLPGCYDVTLTVTSPDGCVGDTTFTQLVCVYDYPTADFVFGPQPTNVLNPTIGFTNMSSGAVSYEWIFDDLGSSTATNPTFTFPNDAPGSYNVCLVATNANNCTDTTCYTVVIDDEFIVYVPNAFTPDGDGTNDFFYPVVNGIDPLEYEFLIFDRWGELIFESHHPELHWGGTVKGQGIAKQDVYVWRLIVKDASTNEQHSFVGHVTLLR